MGMLLKVILIIVAIYMIGKAIIKGVVSWFLGDTVKKMDTQIRQQQDELKRHKKKQEGRITINYQPKQDKNFGKEDGDYVDFEEVR